MANKESVKTNSKKHRPALHSDNREAELINLAINLVEKRLRNGTATSQEVTHFLKLGSRRALLELEKIKHETTLVEAKTKAIESAEKNAKNLEVVMEAMKRYSGGYYEYRE